MVNAISALVGEELEGEGEYWGTVAGKNGFIYGIPFWARRVIKFDAVVKSTTHIGPDFGIRCKWSRGTMTDSGIIYCIPCYNSDHGILKIDTNTDTVTELDVNILPEQGHEMWESCATALNGCIYFMPQRARRIMKLDPNNNDAMSSVGDDLGDGDCKYCGTVVGIDGCVYGIPKQTKRIVKYDPINDTTSFIGQESNGFYKCSGNGALGRDGYIYAITKDGEVLQIDTTSHVHFFLANSIESGHSDSGWGDAILGIDGCIYWPPMSARRILKYDPLTYQASLVGDDFGNTEYKWEGGALASDEVIYCLPQNETRIISIDPWKEYVSSLENNMEQHPDQLGCIFHPSDDMPNATNFDRAVTKFGFKKVLKALEACMPAADDLYAIFNLCPFMIAASFNRSDVSIIYHLLRQVPSLVNYINCTQGE